MSWSNRSWLLVVSLLGVSCASVRPFVPMPVPGGLAIVYVFRPGGTFRDLRINLDGESVVKMPNKSFYPFVSKPGLKTLLFDQHAIVVRATAGRPLFVRVSEGFLTTEPISKTSTDGKSPAVERLEALKRRTDAELEAERREASRPSASRTEEARRLKDGIRSAKARMAEARGALAQAGVELAGGIARLLMDDEPPPGFAVVPGKEALAVLGRLSRVRQISSK